MHPRATAAVSPRDFPRLSCGLILGLCALLLGLPHAARGNIDLKSLPLVDGEPLVQYTSRAYTIFSNLSLEDTREFGNHMDVVYFNYMRRFSGFPQRIKDEMPLFLFRTELQYQEFLGNYGINAANTGGMFFSRPGQIMGLATWTGDRPRTQIFSVLQHEGFHQFAYRHLGPDLPIWVNEGLAQYFEDGILVKDELRTGFINDRRLRLVQAKLAQDKVIDFDRLLNMTGQEWRDIVTAGGEEAALIYAQSWSMVCFLIDGDNRKYQGAFLQYLGLVAKKTPGDKAFATAFGGQADTTRAFEARWRADVVKRSPDELNTAMSRMTFLGEGLKFLHERDGQVPGNLTDLQRQLTKVQFCYTTIQHGTIQRFEAAQTENFIFDRKDKLGVRFRLLEPARDDLPPRIEAPGLSPEPRLVWSRNDSQQLISDFEFR